MSKRKILMSFAVLCMLSTAAVAEGPKAGGVGRALGYLFVKPPVGNINREANRRQQK